MQNFLTVSSALNWAHRTEATPIIKVSTSMAGGGSPPSPVDLTPHERHAQAAFIIAAVEETLDQAGYDFIRAYYMAPGEWKQEHASRLFGRVTGYMIRPSIDPEWAIFQTLEWLGQSQAYRMPYWWEGNEPPADKDWAEFLGKSPGLISQWRNGDKGYPGLITILEGVLDNLRSRLSPEFRERGFLASGEGGF